MKISIESDIDKKLLWLNASYESADEFTIVKKLYLEILSQTLIGSSIKVITIAPQEYSLAYEFNHTNLITINGQRFLLSSISDCDLELLRKVISSEEFRRSLLVIVKRTFDLTDNELLDIVGVLENTPVSLGDEIVFCEDDGDSLCLYNSEINLLELISISKKITPDIIIEAN